MSLSRTGTIVKNIIKWGLICAAVGIAVSCGIGVLAALGQLGAATGISALTLAVGGGIASGFMSSLSLPFAIGGVALGAVLGVGKGLVEAQENCAPPACRTSFADFFDNKEKGGNEPELGNYEALYSQAGINPSGKMAEQIRNQNTMTTSRSI